MAEFNFNNCNVFIITEDDKSPVEEVKSINALFGEDILNGNYERFSLDNLDDFNDKHEVLQYTGQQDFVCPYCNLEFTIQEVAKELNGVEVDINLIREIFIGTPYYSIFDNNHMFASSYHVCRVCKNEMIIFILGTENKITFCGSVTV